MNRLENNTNINIGNKSKPRERIPYGLSMVLGAIYTCTIATLLTSGFLHGNLTGWKNLSKPSSGATHIIDADPSDLWVDSSEGSIFTLSIYCFENKNCKKWIRVNNPNDISPDRYGEISRGTDCANLSFFSASPINPPGKVIECLMAPFNSPDFGSVTYFALMNDGSVKYWKHGNDLISIYFFYCISTIILPIVVMIIISLVYSSKREDTLKTS